MVASEFDLAGNLVGKVTVNLLKGAHFLEHVVPTC